jgi:hypothetical protein
MNKRKKASYGMPKQKMRGGEYIEPNKELQFGGPSRIKAKKGRRKAGHGDYGSEYGNSPEAKARKAAVNEREGRGAAVGAGAARRRQMQEETTRNSPNPPAGTDPKKGTPVGTKSTNPYAEAKKRDSNLDSYVKQRNAAEKGSLDYNEAQNKINKAYGKGPTNRRTTYGPEKKGETAKAATTKSAASAMASQSKTKPTLQTNMVSTSKPAAKPAAEPTGRAKRVAERTEKKVGRIQDRRASAANRESARGRKDAAAEAVKERGATKGMQRAAGRMAKANVKGNEAKASRAEDRFIAKSKRAKSRAASAEDKSANKTAGKTARAEKKSSLQAAKAQKKAALKEARGKMKLGGGRKKAVAGMAVQGAGAALQGIGKITDAIAGKETKFGKIAGAVGSTATQAGGMMGGVPGAQKLVGGAMNAVPPPGGANAAATPPATPPATPDPNAATNAATDASVEQAANQPMRRGGKKRKKYQEGGGKTESMKSALKDRRRKAQQGKFTEGAAKKPKDFGKNTNMEDHFQKMRAKDSMAGVNRLPGGVNDDGVDKVQSIASKNDARRRAKHKKEQAASRATRGGEKKK